MYYVLGTELRQFWLGDLDAWDSLEHRTRTSTEEQSFAYFRLNLFLTILTNTEKRRLRGRGREVTFQC
jgi:hypothetical protein